MTQFMFSVYYPFEPFPKVIMVLLLRSLLTATAPSFPVVILTTYTTSFGDLFVRSIGIFAIRTTISHAYRTGITFTIIIIGVFPTAGAFVFVWSITILAYVGFFVDYSVKASRIASFTYLIVAGVSSLVAVVARLSSSYRLASMSSRIARTSWDNTLGSRPKGS